VHREEQEVTQTTSQGESGGERPPLAGCGPRPRATTADSEPGPQQQSNRRSARPRPGFGQQRRPAHGQERGNVRSPQGGDPGQRRVLITGPRGGRLGSHRQYQVSIMDPN